MEEERTPLSYTRAWTPGYSLESGLEEVPLTMDIAIYPGRQLGPPTSGTSAVTGKDDTEYVLKLFKTREACLKEVTWQLDIRAHELNAPDVYYVLEFWTQASLQQLNPLFDHPVVFGMIMEKIPYSDATTAPLSSLHYKPASLSELARRLPKKVVEKLNGVKNPDFKKMVSLRADQILVYSDTWRVFRHLASKGFRHGDNIGRNTFYRFADADQQGYAIGVLGDYGSVSLLERRGVTERPDPEDEEADFDFEQTEVNASETRLTAEIGLGGIEIKETKSSGEIFFQSNENPEGLAPFVDTRRLYIGNWTSEAVADLEVQVETIERRNALFKTPGTSLRDQKILFYLTCLAGRQREPQTEAELTWDVAEFEKEAQENEKKKKVKKRVVLTPIE